MKLFLDIVIALSSGPAGPINPDLYIACLEKLQKLHELHELHELHTERDYNLFAAAVIARYRWSRAAAASTISLETI
jgi:hypothetical protein